MTASYLTSEIGLGPLAQGILAGLTNWGICSIACGGPPIAAMAIMASLGIISWGMVLIVGLTMVAFWILSGKVG